MLATWVTGDNAEASPAPRPEKAPTPSARLLGLPQNFTGMKSTPEKPPATTTHDEPASVTYIRT